MRKNEFELGEITDDVIVYVDKYIKLLMSNVKYSFLEKYNADAAFVDEDKNIYLTSGMKERFELMKNTYTVKDVQ